MANTPLAVLDLVPISSGSTAAGALRNSIDLARHAERLGYARYWFAEHHLNPGVAGTSPAIVIALTGAATSTIRIGSGAVQLGHRTALSTVEEFGLIDALHPGRLDLGLGRSGGRPPRQYLRAAPGAAPPPGAAPANGLLIPPRFSPGGGQSADVAGRNGPRFAANYHVSPATVLEAADGYRAAFRPSAELDRPHVCVSADAARRQPTGPRQHMS